jgi:putative tryptophan/tyrosine transport system substrate-binding protein
MRQEKHMKEKIRILTLCAMLFALCSSVQAQQSKKVAKIAYLAASAPAAVAHLVEAFRQGLRELGYVEGKSFVLEARYGDGKAERLPELARELVSLKVDVILTGTDGAIAVFKKQTQTIPIVMANSTDPVATGFVASLARPGGNITGLSTISPELGGKRLELLREVVPRLSRAAFIWNPDLPGATLEYKEAEGASRSLRLQLQFVEVRRSDDLQGAFSTVIKGRAEALILAWPNPVLFSNRGLITSFAQRNRLPSIYAQKEFVESEGLMSYGPNLTDLYRRAASYVDKILKGAKPADLPVEQPTKFEFVINLKTAKQIGLTIPPNVLARADKVIR